MYVEPILLHYTIFSCISKNTGGSFEPQSFEVKQGRRCRCMNTQLKKTFYPFFGITLKGYICLFFLTHENSPAPSTG